MITRQPNYLDLSSETLTIFPLFHRGLPNGTIPHRNSDVYEATVSILFHFHFVRLFLTWYSSSSLYYSIFAPLFWKWYSSRSLFISLQNIEALIVIFYIRTLMLIHVAKPTTKRKISHSMIHVLLLELLLTWMVIVLTRLVWCRLILGYSTLQVFGGYTGHINLVDICYSVSYLNRYNGAARLIDVTAYITLIMKPPLRFS